MEGHDTTFLISSAFSVDSGIRPRSVFRNLAPAELYEMVGAAERVVYMLLRGLGWPAHASAAPGHLLGLAAAAPPSTASGRAKPSLAAVCRARLWLLHDVILHHRR